MRREAHKIKRPEMVAPVKPSQQLGTEFCVAGGLSGHRVGREQMLRSVNKEVVGRNASERNLAPKSNGCERADLISLWGRQNRSARYRQGQRGISGVLNLQHATK